MAAKAAEPTREPAPAVTGTGALPLPVGTGAEVPVPTGPVGATVGQGTSTELVSSEVITVV